jgi:predicted Zn-dependent protease
MIGCTFPKPVLPPARSIPPEVKRPEIPKSTRPEETPRETPSPRAIASLELLKRGRLLIEAGKPDEAIRYLERAVNLYPGRGENYYYLAEAWLMKGNASQASEYNTLATVHFKGDPEWIKRIAFQKKLIDKIGKD